MITGYTKKSPLLSDKPILMDAKKQVRKNGIFDEKWPKQSKTWQQKSI